MKKNILVTGCGGAPTTNFIRSLRDADSKNERYFIVGIDYDKYTLHRSECDRSYLCPSAKDEAYIGYLVEIIRRENIGFLHTQPEVEVYVVGRQRGVIARTGCRLLMPRQETIELLRDKFLSYEVWARAGIAVPRNIKINTVDDLKRAFAEFGKNIWVRETIGAAGKGSLSSPTYELAKSWIDMRSGWGNTVAAEHLTNRTTTWQSLWENGKLVVGQGRERLYWEAANRAQSGVTGITGTGKIVKDASLAELAMQCIRAADTAPHGIFSVDFTYDRHDVPNPTEINIGKFFTTHHFITRAGCNMPEIMVQLAFGEYRGPYDVINPCKEDLYWVRGVDVRPVMLSENEIAVKVRERDEILKGIKHDPVA